MAAHSVVVSQFYLDVATLAYAESQMAITPLIPFGVEDSPALEKQAGVLADCASQLRGLDPANAEQSKVDAADQSVLKAQTMFDAINNLGNNSFQSSEVFAAVASAIAAVNSVLT
jgi:hypothetical protein